MACAFRPQRSGPVAELRKQVWQTLSWARPTEQKQGSSRAYSTSKVYTMRAPALSLQPGREQAVQVRTVARKRKRCSASAIDALHTLRYPEAIAALYNMSVFEARVPQDFSLDAPSKAQTGECARASSATPERALQRVVNCSTGVPVAVCRLSRDLRYVLARSAACKTSYRVDLRAASTVTAHDGL